MNDRRHRVLLVEDHDAYALTLVTVLSGAPSIDVVGHASDGRAGVELALAERPDVILMDIYMPGLDGIAATAELTRRLPETAVVMLTSSDIANDIARAREAGAVAYLLKDARLPQLVQTIEAAVAERAASRTNAREASPPRLRARQTVRFCL